MLWQNGTITPAHEHFISCLIKQKVLTNTEKIKNTESSSDRVFVLFLPQDEMHELGLMYINYELVSQGYKSIYLGGNVPLESLKDIKKFFDNITYISYFSVAPSKDDAPDYIKRIDDEILSPDSQLWVIGRNIEKVKPETLSPKINLIFSIPELIDRL